MSGQPVRPRPSQWSDAIKLGGDPSGNSSPRIRYTFLLLVFMRVVACLWVFRGLMQWNAILAPDQEPFARMSAAAASEIFFFCFADLIAGVGLWMATPWGGVLWLFAAAIGLIVTLITPDPGLARHIVFGADVILIVIYFVLSWYSAREREE